jgi:hypothetical protein
MLMVDDWYPCYFVAIFCWLSPQCFRHIRHTSHPRKTDRVFNADQITVQAFIVHWCINIANIAGNHIDVHPQIHIPI